MVPKHGKQTRYQVYFGPELDKALREYIAKNYIEGSRVTTAIIRKAVSQFLKREGAL